MQSGNIIIQKAQSFAYSRPTVCRKFSYFTLLDGEYFFHVSKRFFSPLFNDFLLFLSNVFTSVLDTDLLSVCLACSMRTKPVLRRWQVLLLRLDTDYPQKSANVCRLTAADAKISASADACFALDFIANSRDWTELNWFYQYTTALVGLVQNNMSDILH